MFAAKKCLSSAQTLNILEVDEVITQLYLSNMFGLSVYYCWLFLSFELIFSNV